MTSNNEQNFLRVFWPPYFPSVSDECSRFPTIHPNKFCRYPGLIVEILGILLKDANLTLISNTDDVATDSNPDGLGFYDLVDMMQNDTLDIMGMSFQKTEKRDKIFDFSESLYTVKTRLLRKTQERKLDTIFSFFQTYSSDTWYSFLIAWILQLIFCVLVRRFEAHKIKKKPVGLLECAWSMLRLQLLQPEKISFDSISGNFGVCVFSLFQCSILLGVFSSFILASLITKGAGLSEPMLAMTQMISSGEYYMVTNDPNKWFFEKVNTSYKTPYPELKAALEQNPLRVVETRFEALDLVAAGNAILFQQVDEGSFFEAMSYCGITVLDKNMPMVSTHLLFRKRHPLLLRINQAILRNKQRFNGLALKYYRLAMQYDQCPEGNNYKPLTINPYVGVYLVCLFFIVVATVILILELITAKLKRPLNQLTRVLEMKKRRKS